MLAWVEASLPAERRLQVAAGCKRMFRRVNAVFQAALCFVSMMCLDNYLLL